MINKKKSFFKEAILTVIYAVMFTVVIRTIFYDQYYIPSSSMTPTLRTGDRIFVSKFFYGYSKYSIAFHPIDFKGRILSQRSPKRGDIVVFTLPHNPYTFYVKRVIGIPGDKVEIKNGNIYLNNTPFHYSFIKNIQPLTGNNENIFPVNEFVEMNSDGIYYNIFLGEQDPTPKKIYIVPDNNYFLMGDNRSNSGDSRFESMGFVPFENIVGRAEVISFSTKPSKNGSIFPSGVRFDRTFNSLPPNFIQDELMLKKTNEKALTIKNI